MAIGVKTTGASGEYISSASSPGISFSDFSVIIRVGHDSWSFPSGVMFLTQWTSGVWWAVNNTYMEAYFTTGTGSMQSTALPSWSAGEVRWLGLTIDFDNGSNAQAKFWEGGTGATPSWSQVGSTVNGTSISAPITPTHAIELGSRSSGTLNVMAATWYEASFYSGIGANTEPGQGSLVAEWSAPHTGTRFKDANDHVWTCNGSAFSTVIDDN